MLYHFSRNGLSSGTGENTGLCESVITLPLQLRRALPDEHDVILGLIEQAARWLSSLGSDQWSEPWPDEPGRNARVLDDLRKEKTWLAEDGGTAAATITLDPVDNGVWPAERRWEPAVYLRRLIVDRRYGGLNVGAKLLDWASDLAERKHHAQWIRIDVWTTNFSLHDYYRAQGFADAGLRDLADDPGYPSRALFERSTSPRRADYQDVIRRGRRRGWR
jgi:predicted N-acetyltransferase YhbS